DVRDVVASHTLAVGLHLDGVEPFSDALEPGVGDEDLLIARAFDLEPAPGEAERRDVHEVVALVSREGDCVAAVLVGPRRPGDVAGQRGDGNRGAFDGKAVRPGDAASD